MRAKILRNAERAGRAVAESQHFGAAEEYQSDD